MVAKMKNGKFLNALVIQFTSTPNVFTLSKPLYFSFEENDGTSTLITVPAGFTTDLASIPRILWPIFSPTGKYSAAAVVHDYLYKTHRIQGTKISRKTADKIFLLGMKALNVKPIKRTAMYAAVRCFGFLFWDK